MCIQGVMVTSSITSGLRLSLIVIVLLAIIIASIAIYFLTTPTAPSPSPTPVTSPTPSPSPTPTAISTPLTPQQKVKVKIGLIFPLSGAFAQFGQDTLNGVLAALEMFKQKQILPEVEIEYVIADARTDPTVAASEAERLITVEKVQAILGTYGGALAMAIASVAEKYGVPYFELTAAPNALTINASRKWIFRFGPAGLYYGYSAVDFLVYFANKMGWDLKTMKIAVVHEDSAYGVSCGDGDVERLAYYGLSYVTRERYSAATTDLSSLIMKLKGLGVDVVLITSYASDAILFLRQSHELGFKPKIIIGHSAGFELPAVANAVGELINGVFVVAVNPFALRTEFMAPEVYTEFQEFIQYYRSRFGTDPAGWASKAFTATYHVFLKQVLRIAYEKYKEITRETIRLAFLEVELPPNATFMGFGVKFAPPDHPWSGENLAAAQHPVLQWIDGKMYAVWPEGVAVREPVYIPRP